MAIGEIKMEKLIEVLAGFIEKYGDIFIMLGIGWMVGVAIIAIISIIVVIIILLRNS